MQSDLWYMNFKNIRVGSKFHLISRQTIKIEFFVETLRGELNILENLNKPWLYSRKKKMWELNNEF